MFSILHNRWLEAQQTEKRYWDRTKSDALEFARITYGKIVAVRFLEEAVPDLHRLEGPFVEIGIGPLGVGCIHFIPAVEREKAYWRGSFAAHRIP